LGASLGMNTKLACIAAASIIGSHFSFSGLAQAEELIVTESILSAELLVVGDTIEDFTIPTPISPSGSEEVTLSELLKDGPVVLTFFRGSWCSYCRGELSGIQDRIEDFEALGATVLAISPEVDDRSAEMGKELELGFYIGHDENNELARSLGLTFKLDSKTIKKYREYKIDVPDSNGTRKWELPIPATYVIAQDMTVQFVYDDENYSKRADYKKVLKVVEQLTEED
jgi:peroxiredoxin